MKVRDIMVENIKCAEPDDTLDEVAMMMREQDVGAIPVVEDGELIGIITDRDIVVRCIAEGNDPSDIAADEIISGELQTVEPDSDVEEARRIMSQYQIRRLPVIQNGELVGMVSLGDLAVKSGDEEQVADTLENISEGVKASDHKQAHGGGQKQKQSKRPSASAQTSTQKRDRTGEGDRGEVDRKQRPSAQGITVHSAAEEMKGQSRVVPIRSQQKTNVRGDRSTKPSSRRKTG